MFTGMNAVPRQYLRNYGSLKAQLVNRAYPVGALLPSKNKLPAQFQTTRMTVRQALTELVREGYIERRHGKGSIVLSKRNALGLLSFQGFSDVVGTEHTVRANSLSEPKLTAWPTPFFYTLTDAERRLHCLWTDRIRYADNVPTMLKYTWIPDVGLSAMLTDGLLDGSLFRTLHSRFGLDIRSMDQRIQAVMATFEQVGLLRCPSPSPLLYLERRYQTNRPDLHVYSRLYCFTDQYAISGGL